MKEIDSITSSSTRWSATSFHVTSHPWSTVFWMEKGCPRYSIASAPRGVRVEEPGFCSASGRTPDAVERLANVLALVLAYALFLTAAVLALGAFYVGRPAAAFIAIAAGAVALWLVLEGESALDAQALDEFNG